MLKFARPVRPTRIGLVQYKDMWNGCSSTKGLGRVLCTGIDCLHREKSQRDKGGLTLLSS